jgi:hypothetical protein
LPLIPEGAIEELGIVLSISLLNVCVVWAWGRISLNWDPDELLGPVTEIGWLKTYGVKTCLEPSTISSIAEQQI